MDFDDTPEEAAWRARVRAFLEEHATTSGAAPGRAPPTTGSRASARPCWYDGLVGVTLPVGRAARAADAAGHRGPGDGARRRTRSDQPDRHRHVRPDGHPPRQRDQRSRYLRRLLRADDLVPAVQQPASAATSALRTRAVQAEDGSWRVTGQKVWTTLAHLADYGILLTRTVDVAPPGPDHVRGRHESPRVTVRPLRQMNRRSRHQRRSSSTTSSSPTASGSATSATVGRSHDGR